MWRSFLDLPHHTTYITNTINNCYYITYNQCKNTYFVLDMNYNIYCACVILPLSHMVFYIIKQIYIYKSHHSYHIVFCKLWTRTVRVSQQTLAGATKIWDQDILVNMALAFILIERREILPNVQYVTPSKIITTSIRKVRCNGIPLIVNWYSNKQWLHISYTGCENQTSHLQTFRIYLKHPKAIHWNSPPKKK